MVVQRPNISGVVVSEEILPLEPGNLVSGVNQPTNDPTEKTFVDGLRSIVRVGIDRPFIAQRQIEIAVRPELQVAGIVRIKRIPLRKNNSLRIGIGRGSGRRIATKLQKLVPKSGRL